MRLVLLAFLWLCCVVHAQPTTLVVVSDDRYPPYLFRDGDGRLQGIVKDKWDLWSERTGMPVEVRGMDWLGAQHAVLDGQADIIDTLARTPSREATFEFSTDSVPMEARVYFHHSLAGISNDTASLQGMLVGAKAGSACAEWLRLRGVGAVHDTYPDSLSLIHAAARGEVRIFCMDETVANYFLYREGLSSEFNASQPLYSAPLHWAVRAGRTDLRQLVQKGFDEMPRAELKKINTRWFGNPLRSPIDLRWLYVMGTIPLSLLGVGFVGAVYNRCLKLKLQARNRVFATRDTLTELPTRGLLYDRLGQAIAQAEREGCLVAVLFVDLDRFKAVNDTFGHAAGDYVLKEAAARLQRCARGMDTVARISSDEFVVVLAALARADEAGTFAKRVLTELHHPYIVEGKPVYCTASVGIAVHPGDGTTSAALIQNADIAMYRAKKSGRNAFQFFLPEMHEHAVRRLQIETALRLALDRNEFTLHYQPKIDILSRKIKGFEALLRWQHPELGLLSPAEFIPILEDTDLVVRVGEWVLATVCRELVRWQSLGLEPKPVAINLSARQFRDKHLDATVERIVSEAGIAPGLIELELTESLLMTDPDEAEETLRNLERFGVRIAIDDFGTGYSSLAYLKRFPIDTVKIDRAFVTDVTGNPDDAAIARAIINLGHSLGLTVVAEGVENSAQLDFLAEHGCDEVQGFVFSAAATAQAVEGMLRNGRV